LQPWIQLLHKRRIGFEKIKRRMRKIKIIARKKIGPNDQEELIICWKRNINVKFSIAKGFMVQKDHYSSISS
jgi:hypothetical protein